MRWDQVQGRVPNEWKEGQRFIEKLSVIDFYKDPTFIYLHNSIIMQNTNGYSLHRFISRADYTLKNPSPLR